MPEFANWLKELSSADFEQANFAASHPPEDKKKSLDVLEKLLQEQNPNLRWMATRALAEFDSKEAGDMLAVALDDDDPSVQH